MHVRDVRLRQVNNRFAGPSRRGVAHAAQKEQRWPKRILGGEEDALSVQRRQLLSLVYYRMKPVAVVHVVYYRMKPVAVIHELVLPTEGNFLPWMAEIMTLLS